MFYGGSLLLFLIDIYIIYLIINGSGDSNKKLLWILIVLFLPVLGPILYLLIGRGAL